jgi:hypothetical protein
MERIGKLRGHPYHFRQRLVRKPVIERLVDLRQGHAAREAFEDQ